MIYITEQIGNSPTTSIIVEAVATLSMAVFLAKRFRKNSINGQKYYICGIERVVINSANVSPKITIPDRFKKLVEADWKYSQK